jgi:hypothetical protein
MDFEEEDETHEKIARMKLVLTATRSKNIEMRAVLRSILPLPSDHSGQCL